MEPAAGQLAAAVIALMSSLTARHHEEPGLLAGILPQLSFARWGLEGAPLWHVLLLHAWWWQPAQEPGYKASVGLLCAADLLAGASSSGFRGGFFFFFFFFE